MSDLRSKAFSAFIWDFFGKIARHGTSFIVMIFLARLLEPSEFGLVAMIMVIVYVTMIFTDVGLGSALIQRRRLLPIHYSSVFYFNLAVGSLLTLLLFFSAEWISEFYDNEQLIAVTQVISPLFLINAFSNVQTSRLRKELDYAALTKADVSAAVISGIIGIILAVNGAGAWSLVAQALLRGFFYALFIWNFSRWVPSLLFSLKALMQLWGFGFRMFLSGLLEVIFSRLDIIIIAKLFSPAVLGLFDQAKRLNAMIIQYSSGSIMAVMFPVMSKVQKDLPKFQRIVIKTLGIISFVVFFLLGFTYLIAEDLIVLLFTEKWLPSVAYFQIILLGGFGYPISALLVNILSSRGDSKTFLRLEIYKKSLVGINLYIGFLWGVEGYLYGMIIVTVLSVLLNIVYASREIDVTMLQFLRPIITQMVLTVAAVLAVDVSGLGSETSRILNILEVGSLFMLLYILSNMLFQTTSYKHVKEQVNLFLGQRSH